MQPQDPDRQIEEAKASFVARVEELGRRFRGARERIDEVRAKLDVTNRVASHPLLAVGLAFTAGALLGLVRGRPRKVVVHQRMTDGEGEAAAQRGLLAGLLGAIAMGLVKDLAVSKLSGVARDWYDRRASEQPEIEPFLEH